MKKINPADLVAMDDFTGTHPLRVDLAYARADNILLEQAVYRPEAKLWLHRDLADVVLRASEILEGEHGWTLVLHDGLRTVEAQESMLHTARVKANQHWLEEPRLLSLPGTGAHPRAMAVDVSIRDADGKTVDMGTPFDFLAEGPGPDKNPAHRDYRHPPAIMKNRESLTRAMMRAAVQCGVALELLPQEWWDYRLLRAVYERYAPLRDSELPPEMRMTLSPP